MSFFSPSYAIFLAVTLFIYWRWAKTQNDRLWVITISSTIFYLSFQQLLYFPLIVGMIFVNYWAGKLLLESQIMEYQAIRDNLSDEYDRKYWLPRGKLQRQTVMGLGVAFNLLLLLLAKYIPFGLSILSPLNPQVIQPSIVWFKSNVLPPLGISFLSFESIAYLIDVYRGSPATGNLLKYAAYKTYFPKLVSGPIVQYQQFAPQLNDLKFPPIERLTEGLWFIASGIIKKYLIADNLATFVDLVFDSSNLPRAGSTDLWLAIFAYGWRLYLDFSGYVDIVQGTSILFGIDLPTNFNFPYLATNIADFWRRWHITLGNWLRDFIYIPLGGSYRGLLITCRNLMALMLISGIWHGADWGYLIWGAAHGTALIVHRLLSKLSDRVAWLDRFWQAWYGKVCGAIVTQLFVFLAWIWFRLPDISKSSLVFSHLWGHPADAQFISKIYVESLALADAQILAILIGLTLANILAYISDRLLKIDLTWPVKLTLIPIFIYIVSLLAPSESLNYIYFEF
jgi:alginate O-acetyltransferase complex protein AlgI